MRQGIATSAVIAAKSRATGNCNVCSDCGTKPCDREVQLTASLARNKINFPLCIFKSFLATSRCPFNADMCRHVQSSCAIQQRDQKMHSCVKICIRKQTEDRHTGGPSSATRTYAQAAYLPCLRIHFLSGHMILACTHAHASFTSSIIASLKERHL